MGPRGALGRRGAQPYAAPELAPGTGTGARANPATHARLIGAGSLDELIASRRELLLSQGLDLPPRTKLLDALGDVWSVTSERQACPRRPAPRARTPTPTPTLAPCLGPAVRAVLLAWQAEKQLLSFAAAAVLSPTERAQALGMSDTNERLTHVLCALRAQQRELAAKLALSDALAGGEA